ncbi:MAG: penicillin-binding protein 2 [Alphaproteobacteria bacterium]
MMDGRDQARQQRFTRRALFLSAGAAGVFGTLFGRLYQLQVLDADQYRMKAEENRVKVRLLPPLRGRIVDRFGVELAGNRQDLQVQLVAEDTEGRAVEDILDQLSRVIDLPDYRRARILREIRRSAQFVPVTVSSDLTWRQFAQINLLSPDLPGVQPEVGDTRYYPYADGLVHVVGYVGAVADPDMDDDPLLKLPGFRIGRNGLEQEADTDLRGSAGSKTVEVNAGGRIIRELERQEGQSGAEVVLTIDVGVQEAANKALEGESGAAVVLDVHTGEVIALASQPGFDPNALTTGVSQAEWNTLLSNKYKPLINKAVQGQYPPGSTLKPLVALAALEHGLMRPDETITCTGRVTLGNHDFHCYKRYGHGVMNMHEGIKYSCDSYFYELARRLGVDRMAEMFNKFGLGAFSGIEIPNEKSGLVPTKGWKLAVTGQPWVQGESFNMGIGQGYMLTTPLQLAVMTARLCNGGRAVEPRIVRARGESLIINQGMTREMSISPKNLAVVRRAMDAVTNEVRGTAFASRLDEEGMSMAGKTGTAQVRRITKAERELRVRKNEELPWHLRDHALFVGYGPVETPRYAVAVIVEHGGSGSKAAAPRAREIMRETLLRDPSARSAIGPRMQVGQKDTAREGQT